MSSIILWRMPSTNLTAQFLCLFLWISSVFMSTSLCLHEAFMPDETVIHFVFL